MTTITIRRVADGLDFWEFEVAVGDDRLAVSRYGYKDIEECKTAATKLIDAVRGTVHLTKEGARQGKMV